VLVAAVALNLAARLITAVLPVLIAIGGALVIGIVMWRWHTRAGRW
jgi:hypothetical protein